MQSFPSVSVISTEEKARTANAQDTPSCAQLGRATFSLVAPVRGDCCGLAIGGLRNADVPFNVIEAVFTHIGMNNYEDISNIFAIVTILVLCVYKIKVSRCYKALH